MPVTTNKSKHVGCRISPEHKRLIEEAAKVSGFSVSEFVAHTLVSAATELVPDENVIILTREEWDRFTAALERPPREPSEATKKMVELFNQGRREGDRMIWD